MAVTYREEFVIDGNCFGIEDYKDGLPDKQHFMPFKFREGKAKRFHCWLGGCGIGEFDTIQQARQHVYNYAVSRAVEDLTKVKARLHKLNKLVESLGDEDTFNLAKFKV